MVLPKHEHLTTGKKYCGKEEKLLLRSNFSSFPQYFQYISNFRNPITYIFVKCGCSNNFFLNSANLICRGTDISKYLIESLGIRDNESRLYLFLNKQVQFTTYLQLVEPASVAQSYARPRGSGFDPRRVRHYSFMGSYHEIFSTVVLSLPLIQEG